MSTMKQDGENQENQSKEEKVRKGSQDAKKIEQYIESLYKNDPIVHTLQQNIPSMFEHFRLVRPLGKGSFSKVYLALDAREKEPINKYAVKYFFPIVKPKKVVNEIRILKRFNGESNIVPLHSVHHGNGHIVMIMPLVRSNFFEEVFQVISLSQIRCYMKTLLTALARIHSEGVVHRDVKPDNFPFDFKAQTGSLVDFGLSQYESEIELRILQEIDDCNQEYSQMQTSKGLKRKKCFSHYSSPPKKLRSPLKDLNNNDLSERGFNFKVSPTETTFSSPFSFFKLPFFDICDENVDPQSGISSLKTTTGQQYQRGECQCDADEICDHCTKTLPLFSVPKAGTRGYKAPEVLLRSSVQNSAIDVWSAGTIFASLLSARYPFFDKADEDIDHLAQIIELFGYQRMDNVARQLERTIVLDRPIFSPSLRDTIQCLRNSIRKSNPKKIRPIRIPKEAFDLLDGIMDPNPFTRFSAKQALEHPFFKLSL